jgi:hypothetical protein
MKITMAFMRRVSSMLTAVMDFTSEMNNVIKDQKFLGSECFLLITRLRRPKKRKTTIGPARNLAFLPRG